MAAIIIPAFSGEIPKAGERLLGATNAVRAINCDLARGQLAPLRGPALVESLATPCATIYKHDQDGWLAWEGRVNVAKSAVLDTIGEAPLGHLLITGDRDYPTQYLAGGFTCRLGLPRPEKAPKAEIRAGAIQDGEDAGGDITDSGISRSSAYCFTYVRSLADGAIMQESAPSPATDVLDVPDGAGVALSGFIITDAPEAMITHIRVYRTASGNETGEFHFLCELSLPAGEYLDTIQDADISPEVLQTATWDPVPDDAQGLILASNGVYAAFRGNELLLSEPFYPYAFPADYRLTVEDPIVCLGLVDNTLIILTKGRPYLASGAEPGQTQLSRLPIEQACVAALSRAHVAGGVMHASPDGLMLFTANDQALATQATFTPAQWEALGPSGIMGAFWNGKYYGFFSGTNKGFMFAPGSQDIVWIELSETMKVLALCHHSVDDCLYAAIDDSGKAGIYRLEAGEELRFLWRSKPFFTSRLCGMRALRVEGEQDFKERIGVAIYGPEKRARQKLKLWDSRTKRIAAARAEKLWSLALSGRRAVYEARMAGSVEELEYASMGAEE